MAENLLDIIYSMYMQNFKIHVNVGSLIKYIYLLFIVVCVIQVCEEYKTI